MDWRCGGWLTILMGGLLCGCMESEPQAARVASGVRAAPPVARQPSSVRQRVLRPAASGAIIAVFPGTEHGVANATNGLMLAAEACASMRASTM